jgi:hypothetical protein
MVAEEIPGNPQHFNYYCLGCRSSIRYTSAALVINDKKVSSGVIADTMEEAKAAPAKRSTHHTEIKSNRSYGRCRSRVWCSAHHRTRANPANAMVTAVTAKTLSSGMIVFPCEEENYDRAGNRVLDQGQTSEVTIARAAAVQA